MQPKADMHDKDTCECLYCKLWRVLDEHYAVDTLAGKKETHIDASQALNDLGSIIIEIVSTCPDPVLRRAWAEGVAKFITDHVREPPSGMDGTMLQ